MQTAKLISIKVRSVLFRLFNKLAYDSRKNLANLGIPRSVKPWYL